MDYDALSRRDKRAMNRIRKRHAALVLFGGLNEDGGVEAKKAKLAEADSSGGEEDGQMQGERRDQQAPQTSSGNASTAASSSMPSCSSISPTHFSSTSAKMVASAADNLLEQAKALSREVRQKVVEQQSQPHPRQQGPKFRLQLEKLQGRNLGERELAAFLHKMALGSHNASSASKSAAKWIRFETRWKPLQFLVVRVNCEDRRMLDTHSDAPFIDDYFNKHWIRMAHNVRDRDKFWQAIGTVVQSRHELLIRKIKTSGDPLLALRRPERKAQLLMSLEQMVDSKYPFPTENAPVSEEGNHPKQQAKWKDIMANQGQIPQKSGSNSDGPRIRPTRQIYRCIGEQSPILALDCEMCYTTAERLELTRISVVNEKGETLMDQLVKPHNKITNYITHKSGITEQMLKNVTNRLKDVQRQFCALLTDDTILCGHSLENDLEALQLSHPFCIDTSILFNFAGRANIRSGLKALAKIFLDEDIQQDSRHGHCSLEDARTTLKLLQLKLDKGLQFGNVALGWNFNAWARANGMTITGTRICNATVMEMVKRGPIEGEGADEGQEKGGEGGELTGETKTTSQASEEQKQQQNSDGDDGPTANAKGQFFDFAEAVRIDNAMQKTAQFTDCYHWANEATKRRRSILVAMPEPNAFFKANECASLINLSNHAEWDLADANSMEKADQFPKGTNNKNNNKIHRICSQMAPKLIEHDLIFVELNCPRTMPKAELDKAFGALIEGACNNSMVILVMSAAGGGRSGANALMYAKIHHQQQEQEEKMMGEEEEREEEVKE